MRLGKIAVATLVACLASMPVQAGEVRDSVMSEARVLSTAACAYGYAKSKKTGNCIKLNCGKYKKLDSNGHKCIPKPLRRNTYRGSPH